MRTALLLAFASIVAGCGNQAMPGTTGRPAMPPVTNEVRGDPRAEEPPAESLDDALTRLEMLLDEHEEHAGTR